MFKVKVTVNGQTFSRISGWYLRNCSTFCNQTWYYGASVWGRVSCKTVGTFNLQGPSHSEGLNNQNLTISSDCIYWSSSALCSGKVHACLAVTCHMCFWQNDWDILHATAVTQGWNVYQNKSPHRKLTLEKTILLWLLPGLEPNTFQSQVWCSNHGAVHAPHVLPSVLTVLCVYSSKHWTQKRHSSTNNR